MVTTYFYSRFTLFDEEVLHRWVTVLAHVGSRFNPHTRGEFNIVNPEIGLPKNDLFVWSVLSGDALFHSRFNLPMIQNKSFVAGSRFSHTWALVFIPYTSVDTTIFHPAEVGLHSD